MAEKKALLVDDDKFIRAAVARSLKGRGFTVVEAFDGQDAVELLRFHGLGEDPALCLILSDHDMPRLSGSGLYAEIKKSWPHLEPRFVLASGAERNRRFAAEHGIPFLLKPFGSDDLDAAIADVDP